MAAIDISGFVSLLIRSAAVLAVIAAVAGIAAGIIWLHLSGSTQPKSRGANSHVNADGTPKKAFGTAEEAAELARFLHAKDGADMAVYRCATCKQFHVGRSSKRR